MTESILAFISFYFLIFFSNRKLHNLSLLMTISPLAFYITLYEWNYSLLTMLIFNLLVAAVATLSKYKNSMSINLYIISVSWLLVMLSSSMNFLNFVFLVCSILLLNLLLTNEKVIQGKMYNFEIVKVVNVLIISFSLLFLMENELNINSISLENSYLFKAGFLLMNIYIVGAFGSYSNTSQMFSMLGKFEKVTFMFSILVMIPYISLTGLKQIIDQQFFLNNIDILVLTFGVLLISSLYLNYFESFKLNSPSLLVNSTCVVFVLELISNRSLEHSFYVLFLVGILNYLSLILIKRKNYTNFFKAVLIGAPFTPLFFYKIYTLKNLYIENVYLCLFFALIIFINLFFYSQFKVKNEV